MSNEATSQTTSYGYNLIRNGSGIGTWTLNGDGAADLMGTATVPVEPMISELGDFGGKTLTHVLLFPSKARQLVPKAHCTTILTEEAVRTDQRGVRRGQGQELGCNAGSVEN